MRLVPTLLLLAALPTVAWSQNITREYDRFKDRSSNTIKFELSSIEEPGRRGVTFDLGNIVVGNRAVNKNDSFTIGTIVSYDMRYNRCAGTGVDLLIDGKPTSMTTDMPPFFRNEFAVISFSKKLTYTEAVAFSKAKLVEIRTCSTVYTLGDDQMLHLLDFMDSIQQSPPTTAD
ncbi:hypothetical protein [Stenotrophomonas sp. Iso1]|uniref:hypothetical protein n=1 Tax=Stenotrophomonas sp. Iso1 TaxID=2977283 RepID=UPI0022B7B654|nr:hypothetical protein [Stenotrophomonas sp. Iso1]